MFNVAIFIGTKCPLSTDIGYLVHHLSKKNKRAFYGALIL